ncbi:MAG: hypothetical protein R3B90_22920 [Planctomycetaceae bacterium]
MKDATYSLAKALQVRGLMNIQYAVTRRSPGSADAAPGQQADPDYTVYILEVNPRASRTSPFVSKATGLSLARMAAKIAAGVSLREQGITQEVWPNYTSVKESVFRSSDSPGSTSSSARRCARPAKLWGSASISRPRSPRVRSPRASTSPGRPRLHQHAWRPQAGDDRAARRLQKLGFKLLSTSGTAEVLQAAGLEVENVRKVQEGRPNLLDFMANGDVQFIFNTPSGKGSRTDEGRIRAAAVSYGVPCVTTLPGCFAMVKAIEYLQSHPQPEVRSIQEWIASTKQ